jgi:2-dehydro-3-deoxyphosphogluconate aldolase/(4S)-4-hydroxy-2-oxoglutarate aldolase
MSTSTILNQLTRVRVLPIMVADEVQSALRCVETLSEQGLNVVEITLRTPNALQVLAAVIKACPTVCFGAGTILHAQQIKMVQDVGAAFGVSPGATPTLLKAAADSGLPFFPGASSASEVMLAREQGFKALKLFPFDAIGGVNLLRALHGPFPDVQFCLTGGITLATAPQLLQQPNVLCVGGSWMCPANLIAADDQAAIAKLAAAAAMVRTCS